MVDSVRFFASVILSGSVEKWKGGFLGGSFNDLEGFRGGIYESSKKLMVYKT